MCPRPGSVCPSVILGAVHGTPDMTHCLEPSRSLAGGSHGFGASPPMALACIITVLPRYKCPTEILDQTQEARLRGGAKGLHTSFIRDVNAMLGSYVLISLLSQFLGTDVR